MLAGRARLALPQAARAEGLIMWAERLKRYRWIWLPLAVFALTRLGILVVAYISTPILADSSVPPYHIRPDNILLDVLGSRWDTGFYLSIAEEGYRYQGERLPSVAFFPLMPMLIRAVMTLTGDAVWSGILVANLALAAAVVLLYRFVEYQWGEAAADRAVFYLLIFPASFFGSAIYSESIFLLLSVATFSLARQRHWWEAGLTGLLAAMTRFVGLILTPVLLVEWWVQHRVEHQPEQKLKWQGLAAAVLVPVGTLVYMLYLYLMAGDALAFLKASQAWARTPASPLAAVAGLLERPAQGWAAALGAGALPLDNWLDLSFVIFFLVLGVGLLLRKYWSEAVFVLLGVLIPASSGLLMSQRRYMWVLFPAFILLALWGENRWVDRVVTVVSLMGLALFTAMFANWYWVG